MSIPYLCLMLFGLSLCIFLIAKAVLADGLRAFVSSPFCLFSVYFGLIHFLTPAIKHLAGFYRYQTSYSESTCVYIGMLTFGVYLACWFLLRELQFRFPADIEVGPSYDRLFPVLAFAMILFALGALASYQDYRTITQNVGMDNFLSDRHEAASERGIARVLSNLMVIGFMLFVSAVASDRFNLSRIIILAGMAALSMYYYGLISSRNSILILILFGTMSFILGSRSIRFATLQINKIGMLGIVLISTMCVMYFITLERYSVSDTSAAQERLSNAALYAMDGAFGNDEALLWLWENEFPLQMGETYLAACTNIIPRYFWPEKPLGGGPVLINMINPGAYEIGAKGNNSLTTGFLTEAVMNFGFAGALLVVVAWAAVVHMVMRQLASSTSIYWRNTFLIIWVTLCSGFIHMEFLGYVVKLGMFILPLLVGALLMPRSVMILDEEELDEGTSEASDEESAFDEEEDEDFEDDELDGEDDELDDDELDDEEDDYEDEEEDFEDEDEDEDEDDDEDWDEEELDDDEELEDDEDWDEDDDDDDDGDDDDDVDHEDRPRASIDEQDEDSFANRRRFRRNRTDATEDSP